MSSDQYGEQYDYLLSVERTIKGMTASNTVVDSSERSALSQRARALARYATFYADLLDLFEYTDPIP